MFFKTKSYITNLLFCSFWMKGYERSSRKLKLLEQNVNRLCRCCYISYILQNTIIIIISFPYGCCRCLLLCGVQAVTFVQHNVTSISNRLANWATAVALPSTAPNHAPRQPAPEPSAAVASVATKRFPTDPLAAAGLTSDWRAEIAAASARARGER